MKIWVLLLIVITVFIVACTATDGSPIIDIPRPSAEVVLDPNDSCASLNVLQKDTCYLNQLKCSKMSESSLRETCVAELAIKKGDSSVCDLITSKKTKGYCREQIIEAKDDKELCFNLKDPYWKDVCHYRFAVKLNDGQTCGEIKDTEQKLMCFKEVLLETNEYKYCLNFDEIEADRCLMTLATRLQDVQVCEDVSDEIKQGVCVLRVAKETNNSALCSTINGSFQEQCEAAFM
jgi:hypothetical protein